MVKIIKITILLIVLIYTVLIGCTIIYDKLEEKERNPVLILKEKLVEYVSVERKNQHFPIAIKKSRLGGEISNMDLSDSDLSNVDFSDICIAEVNFTNTNLTNARFGSTKFYNINFSNANLKGVTGLNGTKNGRKFYCNRCDFTGANLEGIDLSYAELEYAKMQHANLSRANLSFANLDGAILNGANLVGSVLHKTNFFNTDVRNARFDGAQVNNLMLMLTILSNEQKLILRSGGAITNYQDLVIAVEKGNDLSYFDFGYKPEAGVYNYLDLSNGDFIYSVAGVARNSDTLIPHNTRGLNVEFRGTNFSYTNFEHTRQYLVDYSNASLIGANLKDSKFYGAKFNNTNFEGADLTNAYIGGDFTNANFQGAKLINTEFGFNSIFFNTNFHNAQIQGTKIHEMKALEGITGISKENRIWLKIYLLKQSVKQNIKEFGQVIIILLCLPIMLATGRYI